MTAGAFNRPRLSAAGAFLGLLAITALARFPSFLLSVVDWDESVYLLIARDLLEGQAPYTGIFDHKPPGIYALFALAQLVFGPSVTAIRVLACLAVAATALVVASLAHWTSGGSRLAAAAAGVLYAALSATMGGLAANTEIFFVLPGAAALLLVLGRWKPGERDGRADWRLVFCAGLVAGLGPQIKALAGVDLVALLVAIAWKLRHDGAGEPGARRPRLLRLGALATSGYLVPTALTVLVFALTGHFHEYVHANLTANLTYAVATGGDAAFSTVRVAEVVASLWLPLLMAGAAVAAAAARGRDAVRLLETPVLVWLLGGVAAIGVTRLVYQHYLLQILPPLCVLCGVMLARAVALANRRARFLGVVVAGALVLVAVKVALTPVAGLGLWILNGRKEHRDPLWADGAAQMAEAIRPSLAPGEQVWSVDCQPVIYYLLDVVVPSRFVVPTQLTDPRLLAMTGADPARELADTLSRCPRYLLRIKSSGKSQLHDMLDAVSGGVYELGPCRGSCCAYRLRDGEAGTLLRRLAAVRERAGPPHR